MNALKKRILAFLCATLLVLSTAACGGGKDSADGGSGGSAADAASAALSKDEYLAEADKLNEAAEGFLNAVVDMASIMMTNADDMDSLNAAIENLRSSKQPFLDFSAITNPAEGFEEEHASLAQGCSDFAGIIDEYCDYFAAYVNGEEPDMDMAEMQERVQSVTETLGTSIAAIEALAAE